MLKRKIYDDLVAWKQRSGGTTALLIDGARRVGKSFIAKEFAENEYKSHIIIDFGNVPKDVLDIFENDSTDLDMFFAKLSVFFGVQLYNRESLIVFDEVQQFPRARQLIKYLVADGRYDYLETGSLIRLKKNVKDIIIPSEEEHLEMFPLDFEEFLWALDDEVTVPFIRQAFEAQKTLGQAVHRKVMNSFRQYLLVGGMPQSILAYLNGKDFAASDMAKRNILRLYRDDVAKFAEGYEDKALSSASSFTIMVCFPVSTSVITALTVRSVSSFNEPHPDRDSKRVNKHRAIPIPPTFLYSNVLSSCFLLRNLSNL